MKPEVSPETLGNRIGEGHTADVYAWEEDYVLKLFHDWFPLHSIEYEAQVAHLVHQSGVDVPAVGELVKVGDNYGLIYERVDGTSMQAQLLTKPWTLPKLARQLATLHRKMHQVSGADTLPTQHQRLSNKIQAAEGLTPAEQQAILTLLAQLPADNKLCHGDFHPNNVLLTASGPSIIDWMDVFTGHPLADVARSSLIMTLADLPDDTPMRPMIELARRWFNYIYLQTYFQDQSVDKADLARWRLVNAAARLSENVPEVPALLVVVRAGLTNLS